MEYWIFIIIFRDKVWYWEFLISRVVRVFVFIMFSFRSWLSSVNSVLIWSSVFWVWCSMFRLSFFRKLNMLFRFRFVGDIIGWKCLYIDSIILVSDWSFFWEFLRYKWDTVWNFYRYIYKWDILWDFCMCEINDIFVFVWYEWDILWDFFMCEIIEI